MISYIGQRLLWAIPLLLGICLVTFSLPHLLPGGPIVGVVGEKASKEHVEEVKRQLGLDRPVLVQFGQYLWRIVRHADLGRSLRSRRWVSEEIRERFPATVELALAAILIAIGVGIPMGAWSALGRRPWLDELSMGVSLVGVSVPVFFVGIVLLLVFADTLPGGDRLTLGADVPWNTRFIMVDALWAGRFDLVRDFARHLILPAVTLATVPLAVIARISRASVQEILAEDYVRTARAKGVPESVVLWKHVLKNALIPILTVVGVQFGYLLAGAVLTEAVFHWQGIGWYVVDAIEKRDFIALQGGILVIASSFVAVNLLVDVLYALVDPRVAYDRIKAAAR